MNFGNYKLDPKTGLWVPILATSVFYTEGVDSTEVPYTFSTHAPTDEPVFDAKAAVKWLKQFKYGLAYGMSKDLKKKMLRQMSAVMMPRKQSLRESIQEEWPW